MRPRRGNSPWTEEFLARLKALHARGSSYREIAAALGISRSAAIGKAMRLGLGVPPQERVRRQRDAARAEHLRRREAKQARTVFHTNVEQLAREPRPERNRQGWNRGGPSKAPSAVDPSIASLAESRPCTLLDLSSMTCRWPLWADDEPEKLFCGAEALPDCPYCTGHARIAFDGRPTRRDARWSNREMRA